MIPSIFNNVAVRIIIGLGTVGSLITIASFVFGIQSIGQWLGYQPSQTTVRYPVEMPIRETPVIELQQMPNYTTPIPPLSLQQMLDTALLAPSSKEKDEALRIVAERATKMGEYALAIKAADSSLSSQAETSALAYVARCAAMDNEFSFATEAVDKIDSPQGQNEAAVQVTKIKDVILSYGELSQEDPIYIECTE